MRSNTARACSFLLFIFTAFQLSAQSGLNGRAGLNPAEAECVTIVFKIKDSKGRPIMDAHISDDDSVVQYRTNASGKADLPCWLLGNRRHVFEIGAPGYRSVKITVSPESGSSVDLLLDRVGSTINNEGNVVTLGELSQKRENVMRDLQEDTARALAAGDYQSAERRLIEALQMNPTSASIANSLGVVALRQKHLDEAGAWFRKAVELAPFNGDILGNLGLLLWMQKRTEESFATLSRAGSLGYRSSLGDYILGTVALGKGQAKEAVRYLQKISADQFGSRDLFLSIAWRALRKSKAADKCYIDYLRRNPVQLQSNKLEIGRAG